MVGVEAPAITHEGVGVSLGLPVHGRRVQDAPQDVVDVITRAGGRAAHGKGLLGGATVSPQPVQRSQVATR